MKKRILSVLLSISIGTLLIAGCLGANNSADNASGDVTGTVAAETLQYSEKLFDQSYVHEINIQIDEEDWTDLKENPLDKTKYEVNVEIDGEEIDKVSFATKGNTSLSSVASDEDSDRYSFKINFEKYVDGQTYYGLDKLVLNNLYADATYMKDYISYEIFRAARVEAPLTSYVELKINGESFGLYLALEEVGDSFLERNDEESSELYKPESEMFDNIGQAGDDGHKNPFDGGEMPKEMPVPSGDVQMSEGEQGSDATAFASMPDGVQKSDDAASTSRDIKMPGGVQMPGFDTGSSLRGADLAYTDDEIESYSDIFDNAVTDVTEEDEERVIAALKKLSEGDAESALDTTEVINYFVAHNFVLNYDSYTGTMLHNYYLMETDGKLSIIPWDYNLGFGAFSGRNSAGNTDASALINCGIDSPLSGTTDSTRPLWAFIRSSEEYLAQYHEACSKLMEYMNSGELQTEINRVYEMIHSYVENDNSAFYTVDEFETACETLISFCELRTESITKQLDGSLATITDEQNEDDRVDASTISISDMGSQDGMQGGMDFHQKYPNNLPKGMPSPGFDPNAASKETTSAAN